MKGLGFLWLVFLVPLSAAKPINSESPKHFDAQGKRVEKTVIAPKEAPRLYRDWVNVAKPVRSPSVHSRTLKLVTPSVRKPALEQTFFKTKEWKPKKMVRLYEKSKDFDKFFNPLSLKDFNRFVYQRNPRTP